MALAGKLAKRLLGKTGLEVTIPALGGVGLAATNSEDFYGGISDQQAIDTVHTAISRGINFLDTSPLYNESERRIGLALRELSAADKKDLIISSKVGDECPPFSDNGGHNAFSYDGVLSSVDHSLKQLGVDRLDLVLVHDPLIEELQRFLQPNQGMDALRKLQKDGVVGHLGIGCVENEHHMLFMDEKDADVVLWVNDFNLVRRYAADDLFPRAEQDNVGIINAGAYYMGLLAAPQTSFTEGFKIKLDNPQLVDLAQRMEAWWEKHYNIPIRVPALQFSLQHKAVSTVLVGCRSAKEVNEICDAMEVDISEAMWNGFEQEFGQEVRDFNREWHWFYDKRTAEIN